LALALHNYSTAAGAFPPGIDTTVTYPNGYGGYSNPLATWTAWSAQSLLLPYVEQAPLYNAANFNWNCCFSSGQGDATNLTVYFTRIASFLCPSDGLAGTTRNINSYYGSIGTSTIQYPADGNTTGIFLVYNSNANCGSVSLAGITDGTSNTIAFGEGLVGDYGKNASYRGNGMSAAGDGPKIVTQTMPGNNAENNPAAVLAALQSCNSWWATAPRTTCVGYGNNGGVIGCDYSGLKQYDGVTWALGERGATLFNTIVPPNSKQYPWHSCRMDPGSAGGCLPCAPEGSSFVNAQSNHPGGANFAFGDGSVRFIKDTVSMTTYMSLGTRAGGEVVSADSY
jgi:prepilin-type processing-associated H-X9-DG protein